MISAHDPNLDRDVALKLTPTKQLSTSDFRSRLVREGQTLPRPSVMHVAHLFDFKPEGDQPYLVMELAKGRTLRQIPNAQGAQPPARVQECAW